MCQTCVLCLWLHFVAFLFCHEIAWIAQALLAPKYQRGLAAQIAAAVIFQVLPDILHHTPYF